MMVQATRITRLGQTRIPICAGKRRKCHTLRRKCDKCPLRFYSHFCLFVHLGVHEKACSTGWFNCTRCEKRFTDLVCAVKHRQRHLPIEGISNGNLLLSGQQVKHYEEESTVSENGPIFEEKLEYSDSSMLDAIETLISDTEGGGDTSGTRIRSDDKLKQRDVIAVKFLEQLKAALFLDKEPEDYEADKTLAEDLQVSEISSSNNPKVTDTSSGTEERDLRAGLPGPPEKDQPLEDRSGELNDISQYQETSSVSIDREVTNTNEEQVQEADNSKQNEILDVCYYDDVPKDDASFSEKDINHREPRNMNIVDLDIHTTTTENSNKAIIDEEGMKACTRESFCKPDRKYACCICTARFVCFSRLRRHNRVVHNKYGQIDGDDETELSNGKLISKETNKESSITVACSDQYKNIGTASEKHRPVMNSRVTPGRTEMDLDAPEPVPAVISDSKLLFTCHFCKATFLTLYGKNHHIRRRHKTNSQSQFTEANYDLNQPDILRSIKNENVPFPDISLSGTEEPVNGYHSDSATSCNHCDIKCATVQQRRSHTLYQHGTEVTFDQETVVFRADELPWVQGVRKFDDKFTDDREIYHGHLFNYCKVCKVNFSSTWSLKRHMLRAHNIDVVRRSPPGKLKINNYDVDFHPRNKSKTSRLHSSRCEASQDEAAVESPQERTQSLAKRPKEEDCDSSLNLNQFVYSAESCEGTSSAEVVWKTDLNKKIFVCLTCDFRFSGHLILKRHLTEKHGISMDVYGRTICKTKEDRTSDVAITDKCKDDVSKRSRPGEEKLTVKEDKSFVRISSITESIDSSSEDTRDDDETNLKQRDSATKNDCLELAKNRNGKYQCSVCSKEFTSLIDRYIHIIDRHNKSTASSKPDASKPNSQPKMKETESQIIPIAQEDETRFKCSVCESTFESMKSMRHHMASMHSIYSKPKKKHRKSSEKGDQLITQTNSQQNSNDRIDNNKASATPSTLLVACSFCEEKFASWKDKHQHQLKMHHVSPKINTARKSFGPRKRNLSLKKVTSIGSSSPVKDKQPVEVEQQLVENDVSVLAQTTRPQLSGSPLTFHCNQCSRSFSTTSNLGKHLRNHHGSQPNLKRASLAKALIDINGLSKQDLQQANRRKVNNRVTFLSNEAEEDAAVVSQSDQGKDDQTCQIVWLC